jgi:uncharacterized protein
MNKQDIVKIAEQDSWMMDVLRAAQSLYLPDWMIGAGFVRNKVWDVLHGYKERTPLNDIDLIYFDTSDTREDIEKEYEKKLANILNIQWSVKNQARMHLVDGEERQRSCSEDGLAKWVETPTCTAIRINNTGDVELIAPHGISDLVNLVVRPTPEFKRDIEIFRNRVSGKKWLEKWPKLQVVES